MVQCFSNFNIHTNNMESLLSILLKRVRGTWDSEFLTRWWVESRLEKQWFSNQEAL